MKKLLLLLLIFSYGFSQTSCELCVEQNGLYCGDDESNWTQYSPLGCVPNGLNDLFYLNDGWLDCVDGSDEGEAVPTTLADCEQYVVPCDTVFVTDTLYIDNFITEYIDCETGLPCNQSGIIEILKQSQTDNKIYNIQGKEVYRREGLYIENGVINFKNK
tara:strand:- start:58 stop:537 length:480 start_codon:yes stop_codon:yes gene_type:complete